VRVSRVLRASRDTRSVLIASSLRANSEQVHVSREMKWQNFDTELFIDEIEKRPGFCCLTNNNVGTKLQTIQYVNLFLRNRGKILSIFPPFLSLSATVS
jgi:hypothetical protein